MKVATEQRSVEDNAPGRNVLVATYLGAMGDDTSASEGAHQDVFHSVGFEGKA